MRNEPGFLFSVFVFVGFESSCDNDRGEGAGADYVGAFHSGFGWNDCPQTLRVSVCTSQRLEQLTVMHLEHRSLIQ